MLIQKCNQGIYQNYSSSIANPKLIKLSANLTVALFELMKLVPAKYTLHKALKEGKIDPKCPIVETSSGTYALGLAITCSELKLPFLIISDPVIDEQLDAKLKELGGEVQIISTSAESLDVQTMRLNTLSDYLRENPHSFWPAQYDNPDNRHSYYGFADLLIDKMGNDFTLVGPVGSGGSTCGTIERLRQANDRIQLIGVDTFGSALFGLKVKNRKLRGLGNSLLPKNVIQHYFDQVHWLSAECAFKATRILHKTTGLFCGPTTGAAYHVAKWYAQTYPDESVVFIAPDSGHRYVQTVYNDTWLKEQKLDLSKDFSQGHKISRLAEAQEDWAYFNWNRKTYDEVTIQNG